MILRLRTLFFLFFLTNLLIGQKNLIKNPSFENFDKKPKMLGEINKATSWSSVNSLYPADFFITDTRKPDIRLPFNIYGDEKPKTGKNYAGIIAYSYRGKFKRTYLKTKLSEPMEAGKKYCVKFYISLADLSKYAVSHLGVHFSDDNVVSKKSTLLYTTHVKSRNNDVYSKQYSWTPVCGLYQAFGEEKYLSIGNFTKDDSITKIRVRRPKTYRTPQFFFSYYYIDDVSIIKAYNDKNCFCEQKKGLRNLKVVKSSFKGVIKKPNVKIIPSSSYENKLKSGLKKNQKIASEENKASLSSNKNSLITFKIPFGHNSYNLTPSAKTELDKVAEVYKSFKSNSKKIILNGYYSKKENSSIYLDIKRTAYAGKYLLSKGISKSSIARKHFKNQIPEKLKQEKTSRVYIEIK